jgi:zinc protease
MMFRGTKAYPPEKYEQVLKETGASSNAFTDDDLTVYHTTFSKEDLEAIVRMEADRFQNLDYPEAAIKTEALAVLGEYNKNSTSPERKIEEVLRDTAFDRHTYKHTTLGFLKDVQDMPQQYAYSKQFFDRYYRPEYTTILVVGDVTPARAKPLIEKYWGSWKRGSFKPQIPAEQPQKGARRNHVDWPIATLPWVKVAFRGPAYTDTEKDSAALDIISYLGFSPTSELYQKLVVQDQVVDTLGADNFDHVDPYLFSVEARVKSEGSMKPVEEQILSTFASFKDTLVSAKRLEDVKKHLRYQMALQLNNSESVARLLAHYIALKRTPETIDRLMQMYDSITPEDIRNVARKYFNEDSRTTVTLTGAAK